MKTCFPLTLASMGGLPPIWPTLFTLVVHPSPRVVGCVEQAHGRLNRVQLIALLTMKLLAQRPFVVNVTIVHPVVSRV